LEAELGRRYSDGEFVGGANNQKRKRDPPTGQKSAEKHIGEYI